MASANLPSVPPRSGFVPVAICSAVATMLAAGARAGKVDLAFDSLPSAQGFVYDVTGNAAPEGSIYSVDGTALHQNTIGIGLNPAGSRNSYFLPNVVDPAQPYSLTVRARVTRVEQDPSSLNRNFGFFFEASDGARGYGIGITPTVIESFSLQTLSATIDNTVFHDYRLDVTPGGPGKLFVDGAFVADFAARINTTNRLAVGDGTGFANASADVARLQFRQVPEPVTAALLAPATMLAMARRKRRHASVGF